MTKNKFRHIKIKAYQFFSIAFISLCVMSCNKKVQQELPYATISGKIENLKGGTIWMLNFDGWEKYINVKEDGTFLETIRIEKPGAYLLDFEKKRSEIYMSNNTSIQFYADAKDFLNTLKFKGDYESLNNHLAYKAIANKTYFSKMEELYSLSAEDCKKRLNIDYVVPFLKSLKNVINISEELRNLEQNNIHYQYLSKLGIFQFFHSHHTKNKKYKAPEWLNKEVNEVSKEDDVKLLQYSTAYALKLQYAYSGEAYKIMKKDSLPFKDAYEKVIASIKNETVKNNLLFESFRSSITKSKNKKLDFKNYLASNTDESYKKRATKLFQKTIKLEPGSPAPKFIDYENHAGGTASLDDYKGKYVYVDLWATWCGPCKGEIPFLEKIEQQYHNKAIEFVTISVDYKKDYDRWRNMVTEKKMKGIQLIAPDAFNSKFISAYNVQAIPRFILIDPKGNLVTANAPFPSDEKLIDLFNELEI